VPWTLWRRPSPSSRSIVTSIPRQSGGMTAARRRRGVRVGIRIRDRVASAATAASDDERETERVAGDRRGLRGRPLRGELLEERRQGRRGLGVG
jgi:hypothetical protein